MSLSSKGRLSVIIADIDGSATHAITPDGLAGPETRLCVTSKAVEAAQARIEQSVLLEKMQDPAVRVSLESVPPCAKSTRSFVLLVNTPAERVGPDASSVELTKGTVLRTWGQSGIFALVGKRIQLDVILPALLVELGQNPDNTRGLFFNSIALEPIMAAPMQEFKDVPKDSKGRRNFRLSKKVFGYSNCIQHARPVELKEGDILSTVSEYATHRGDLFYQVNNTDVYVGLPPDVHCIRRPDDSGQFCSATLVPVPVYPVLNS